MEPRAFGQRDIIYSARYYTPPASHIRSYFQLYRINPDGHGRLQLTFGRHDDTNPQWSPDGRSIAFIRDNTSLCGIAGGGGCVHLVHRILQPLSSSEDILDAKWWPDSKGLVVCDYGNGGAHGNVYDVQAVPDKVVKRIPSVASVVFSPSGQKIVVLSEDSSASIHSVTGVADPISAPKLRTAIYVGEHRIVGLPSSGLRPTTIGAGGPVHKPVSGPDDPCEFLVLDGEGHRLATRTVLPHVPATVSLPDGGLWGGISAIPGDPNHFLLNYANRRESAIFRVDVGTGNANLWLADGWTASFSEGGERFVADSSVELNPYGSYRSLWMSSLKTGWTARPNRAHTIVGGRTLVAGVDWRVRASQ